MKVYQTSDQKMDVNEVDFEEAKKIIAEAKAKGRFIVNNGEPFRQKGETLRWYRK